MVPRALRLSTIAGAVLVMCAARTAAQEATPADSQPMRARPASSAALPPLTLGDKATLYSDRTFSVRAVLGASFAAGIAQWRDTPAEWGDGMRGYARRDAAAYGGGVIRNTTEFGIGALLHEDPRFERSTHDGFAARTADALHNTVFIRTDDGRHRFAWSRAAAAFATGFAVNSWEPRRLHSPRHAIMLSLGGLTSYATGNFMREFTPDIKRFLFRKMRK